ncbi:MBL fold metallo-hydrolase [[Clostridium] colinum]|uniref:MBL fold metallo-hydrolase n=1 Tax=[Clostridium] colinum TaxID=36835 RepID=UPI002025536D|nr:MBL fold metallo-hydrolase [[Clostridium] colinum]
MKVKVEIVGGAMMQNCYFAIEENTNNAIVIDPGADADKLIDVIEKEKLNLKYIVLTHGHFDHIGACEDIKEKYNTPIVICEGEETLIEHSENNLSHMINCKIEIKADIVLKDNDIFKFGDRLSFKVIKTPGHTPGGMCLYFEEEKVLFSGDTLFYGSVGRTDFPYGNSSYLIKSINRLKELPDDTVVYCGHGNKTTIGTEKNINPYMGNMYEY